MQSVRCFFYKLHLTMCTAVLYAPLALYGCLPRALVASAHFYVSTRGMLAVVKEVFVGCESSVPPVIYTHHDRGACPGSWAMQ